MPVTWTTSLSIFSPHMDGACPVFPPFFREVTSKLQTVLEETLMKNIQLQKMVEILQKEATQAAVTQPSRQSPASASPSDAGVNESPEVVAEHDMTTAM